MQEPLLSAIPPDPQGNQNIPDPVHGPFGLAYPRWPFLSAIVTNVVGGIGCLFWRFGPCSGGMLQFVCNVNSWPGWLDILVIWLFFLIGWLLCFIFGYGVIEVSRHREQGVSGLLRRASHFEPTRNLLLIYAGLALCGIFVMVLLNRFQPVPFALASLLIFVAFWVVFRRRPARQLNAQEIFQASTAGTTRAGYVFRSLPVVRGIWRPDPPNPGTAAPGMQQTGNQHGGDVV